MKHLLYLIFLATSVNLNSQTFSETGGVISDDGQK